VGSTIGAREAPAARREQVAGKRAAPRRAAVPVGSGMLGLGSGTTADFALDDLAARLEDDGELPGPVEDLAVLAASLLSRAGVAEAGPFCGLASDLIIVGPGGVWHREIRGHG
jgi:ribose 5-phosphate isomerase